MKAPETALSELFHERGLDGQKKAAVRAKGDKALFGGSTTQQMKAKYGIMQSRPLADYLPTLSIAAIALVNEMTKLNVETKNVHGEVPITDEHVQNSRSVRSMLGNRGIQPENLPPAEDISKFERRLAKEEKQITVAGLGELSGRASRYGAFTATPRASPRC